MFGSSRKKKKPTTEAEVLADAFAAVKTDQERKARIRKKEYRRWWPEWLDRRVVIGLLVILVGIIADGVRRENAEFYAAVTFVQGAVYMQPREGGAGRPLVVGDKLESRNVVRTDQRSSAVLEFPDGSVVTVAPNTHLVVKMIEYSRGGAWRGRSFFLRVGQIWARVSPRFGTDSEMRVYTPSSVAAVRGTTFSVYQAPQGGQSNIQCVAGSVAAIGFRGRPQLLPANAAASIAQGQAASRPQSLTTAQKRDFNQMDLTKPIPPELWLETLELTITQVLDAPLSILGIGKSSWGVGSADFARRTVAIKALQLLHVNLTDVTYPQYLNPATLEQLGIPQEATDRILGAFHGEALELYRPLHDTRGFIIFARARDKNRTLYKLTTSGPQAAAEDELQRYW